MEESHTAAIMSPLLMLSIVLIAGLLGRILAKSMHVPGMTGNLAAGIIIGPTLLNLFHGIDDLLFVWDDMILKNGAEWYGSVGLGYPFHWSIEVIEGFFHDNRGYFSRHSSSLCILAYNYCFMGLHNRFGDSSFIYRI